MIDLTYNGHSIFSNENQIYYKAFPLNFFEMIRDMFDGNYKGDSIELIIDTDSTQFEKIGELGTFCFIWFKGIHSVMVSYLVEDDTVTIEQYRLKNGDDSNMLLDFSNKKNFYRAYQKHRNIIKMYIKDICDYSYMLEHVMPVLKSCKMYQKPNYEFDYSVYKNDGVILMNDDYYPEYKNLIDLDGFVK